MPHPDKLIIRHFGLCAYEPVWRNMQNFTRTRNDQSPDELWVLQHPAVFTLGLNAKQEHLLNPDAIPVITVDRGGQVTYHGPGQLVIYTLLDVKRLGLGIRQLVTLLEQAVITMLADFGLTAHARADAPGVYVDGSKIAALGLRIKQGCSYHGLALNVDMELEPFSRINPCGHNDLAVTQMKALGVKQDMDTIATALIAHLHHKLGYNKSATDDKQPQSRTMSPAL